MKQRIVLTVAVILILAAPRAFAVGIGAFGTGGYCANNWSYKESSGGSTNDYFYGGGLILETASAIDTVFGYRLKLAYEQYVLTIPETKEKSKPIHNAASSHTFGFGVVRNQWVRFWIGPQLGIRYFNRTEKVRSFEFVPTIPPVIIPVTATYTFEGMGVDAMVAFGVNVHLGNAASLFFDIGVGYMGKYGFKGTIGNGFGVQGSAGVLFRIKDTFAAANQ